MIGLLAKHNRITSNTKQGVWVNSRGTRLLAASTHFVARAVPREDESANRGGSASSYVQEPSLITSECHTPRASRNLSSSLGFTRTNHVSLVKGVGCRVACWRLRAISWRGPSRGRASPRRDGALPRGTLSAPMRSSCVRFRRSTLQPMAYY